MISSKQIIVKYATASILLHCDVIGNIHYLSDGVSDRQSYSKYPTSHDILDFCPEFCMTYPHDPINEIYTTIKNIHLRRLRFRTWCCA